MRWMNSTEWGKLGENCTRDTRNQTKCPREFSKGVISGLTGLPTQNICILLIRSISIGQTPHLAKTDVLWADRFIRLAWLRWTRVRTIPFQNWDQKKERWSEKLWNEIGKPQILTWERAPVISRTCAWCTSLADWAQQSLAHDWTPVVSSS